MQVNDALLWAFGTAFIWGWLCRGWFDAIILHLLHRVLASAWGKKAVLETLAKGLEKLEPPHANR